MFPHNLWQNGWKQFNSLGKIGSDSNNIPPPNLPAKSRYKFHRKMPQKFPDKNIINYSFEPPVPFFSK